jgi:hypothetical protein
MIVLNALPEGFVAGQVIDPKYHVRLHRMGLKFL